MHTKLVYCMYAIYTGVDPEFSDRGLNAEVDQP